jgi:glycosyltransferase involved in cell wall biosynthesis
MTSPLVSIICTCYNHGKYIQEALDSVAVQNYSSIELVIIDNGSQDDSVKQIKDWVLSHQHKISIETVFHPRTLNYCRSFNLGLAMIKGEYVIDLSGDDVMLPGHVATAVKTLEDHPDSVYFSNAFLEEAHKPLSTFYPVDDEGKPLTEVVSGDIYEQVVQLTPLCAPTLVFPTQLLVRGGGYDEGLSYEDFDVIVRLARNYNFIFNEQVGVRKRILKSSFAAQQYRVRNSVMLPSTLKVCHKIREMNRTQQEDAALAKRVMFEAKHALASANFDVAAGFLDLAEEMGMTGIRFRVFRIWEKTRFDFSFLYGRYVGLR